MAKCSRTHISCLLDGMTLLDDLYVYHLSQPMTKLQKTYAKDPEHLHRPLLVCFINDIEQYKTLKHFLKNILKECPLLQIAMLAQNTIVWDHLQHHRKASNNRQQACLWYAIHVQVLCRCPQKSIYLINGDIRSQRQSLYTLTETKQCKADCAQIMTYLCSHVPCAISCCVSSL